MIDTANTEALADESRSITHYLLGKEPPHDLVQRYIEANAILFSGGSSSSDLAMVAFVQRNPWSLPYLDSALSILRPDCLLRNKILLMVAILEATPQFTDAFRPEPFSIPQFFWRMGKYGISSIVKFLTGVLVYPFAAHVK
jgi:hypothetical protein